jgi:multiple sugar transport system substrate-binding protein
MKLGGAGLAGAALLGATGCGGDQRGAESRENVKGAKTLVEGKGGGEEIVFWTSFTSPVDVDALKRIVNGFNEQSSDAQVTMIQVPGDETDVSKLMTAVRGGVGPDVYHLDRFTCSQRAADGVLQPLDKYVDSGMEDRYLDFAWNEILYEGKPYGLPFDTDVRALYYRRDMLEKAGVDPDEMDPQNGPVTVARVREISLQVNQMEGGNYRRIGFIPWFDQGFHYTWGFDFGGEFFDPESCEVTPTDPKVVEAFQVMFYDWAEEMGPEKVSRFIDTYFPPPSPPPAQHPFITGRLAMVVTGDFFLPIIDRYGKDIDYGVTYLPLPEGRDEPTTWSGGWSAVIPQGAQNPDAAYEFASYMCGEEAQRIYVEDTQHLPTLEKLLDEDDLYSEEHTFFKDLLPVSRSRPPLPVGAQYWDELTAAQESVTLNREEPQAALQNVKDRVQRRLERYCPIEG